MFELKFSEEDPLFCLAFHPSKPEFVVGLATGKVTCYEYNNSSESDPQEKWSTKRHKGSCRALCYDYEGDFIFSAGSDKIMKKCHSNNGKVTHKAKTPSGATCICINEEYVTIGDEDANVSIFKHDLGVHRQYKLPEIDSVTAIQPLLGMNKHNFAVAGDTFLFRIDARQDEPKSQSEDQEDEILCGCVPSDSLSAWGMSEGVLTVWKNQGLSDQQYRIKLAKNGSVDCILNAEDDGAVIAGTSEGKIFEVDITTSKVLFQATHSADEEDVMFLDYDYEFKLVSGSMTLLKVWDYQGYRHQEELESKKRAAEQEDKQNKKQKQKQKQTKAQKKQKQNQKQNDSTPSPFADLV